MIEQRKTRCADCQCHESSPLKDEVSAALDERKRTLVLSRGETVFFQNDPADAFFCIQSGSVQIYRNSPGREHSFFIAGPGEWIGHRDVLLGNTHSHSARTLSRTTLCKIPARILQTEILSNPVVLRSILVEMAAGWERSERQSYNLGARSVPERLADFLLNISHESEETDLPCTREVIGTLTGTSTETVIRTLSAFKARGWIDTPKGRVLFRKKNELKRLVAES